MQKINISQNLYELLINADDELKNNHISYLIKQEYLTGIVDFKSVKLHGDDETFIGVKTGKVHQNTHREFYIEFRYTDNKVILIWMNKWVNFDFTSYDILHTSQTYDLYEEFSGYELMLADNRKNQELKMLIDIENNKFE